VLLQQTAAEWREVWLSLWPSRLATFGVIGLGPEAWGLRSLEKTSCVPAMFRETYKRAFDSPVSAFFIQFCFNAHVT